MFVIFRVSNENRETSPPSWTRRDEERFSKVELPATRDTFWRSRNGGRPEIWEALEEAAECGQDLERKQEINDTNNIRLEKRDMTVCFDHSMILVRSFDSTLHAYMNI
ncbi:putative Ubiquitin domain-containing protein [Helianthus annuus]|nr:putative Ubiquitin domain-containing protein [Helianthus annuus]KAJ0455934.1 putative Ubiquitin domain-containing protein [Helianthus annuus]KAJ0473303.1 putative Ubiquitin domain-containing protein [Helianthus annuus]KAJ0648886.1 putative Ubiquitin domain-containing protein [Helianthus annuus]KAJ0652693.1 putative Ubiquitin domain-containing protein [Helianthus annuus]